MQAMQPMIEILNNLPVPTDEKIPRIDNENNRINQTDHIVDSSQGSASNGIIEIEKECGRISKDRGDHSNEVFDMVKNILTSSPGDEELQSSLFDILGFEEFELISKIVQNKSQLLASDNTNDVKEQRFLTPEERAQQLIENHERAKNQKLGPKQLRQEYPHVFKKPDVGNMLSITGKKFSLPVGTTRERV